MKSSCLGDEITKGGENVHFVKHFPVGKVLTSYTCIFVGGEDVEECCS